MKKIFNLVVVFITLFLGQKVSAEVIRSYDVDMFLNQDSSVLVTEKISYDFESTQRHGIFRYIPRSFEVKGQEKMNGLKKRNLDFEFISVKRNGKDEPYSIEQKDSNNNFFIKIGNPHEKITGLHSYTIQYKVFGSLRYFENYDEIYWNAIGDKWDVIIEKASIDIRSDTINFINTSCYVGSAGSNQSCSSFAKKGNKASFSEDRIFPGNYFTVAASFDKDLVAVDERYSWGIFAYIAAGFIALVGIISVAVVKVRLYVNKYKIYDPIYVRYEPPQELEPIHIGYLIDKSFDGRDMGAGLIYLAQQGYLKIERLKGGFLVSDDYKFTRTEKDSANLATEYVEILDVLFVYSNEIKLSKVSKSPLVRTKESIRKHLNSLFVERSYIENLFKGENNGKALLGILVMVGSIFASTLFPVLLFATVPLMFVGISVLAFIGKRYTKKGWEAKHAIEGFKDFLSMTEKDRYEKLNHPFDDPQEFMEYLPCAIAMGVEKKWAKQFERFNIENPDWYSGTDNFNAGVFAGSLASMTNALSKAATPKSSGSGSSGGGFSGGGSGGGGGGSW